MARPNKLQNLKGDPAQLIPAAVNKHGNQTAAAKELGISPTTVNQWLKANGYELRRMWVRPEKDKRATDEFIAVISREES